MLLVQKWFQKRSVRQQIKASISKQPAYYYPAIYPLLFSTKPAAKECKKQKARNRRPNYISNLAQCRDKVTRHAHQIQQHAKRNIWYKRFLLAHIYKTNYVLT